MLTALETTYTLAFHSFSNQILAGIMLIIGRHLANSSHAGGGQLVRYKATRLGLVEEGAKRCSPSSSEIYFSR